MSRTRRTADDWRAIVAARPGMSASEIARDIGVTVAGVSSANRRHELRLVDGRAERMRRLNADPEFAKANAERSAERMRQNYAAAADNARLRKELQVAIAQREAHKDRLVILGASLDLLVGVEIEIRDEIMDGEGEA